MQKRVNLDIKKIDKTPKSKPKSRVKEDLDAFSKFSDAISTIEQIGAKADILVIEKSTMNILKDEKNIDYSKTQDKGAKLRAFDLEKYIETHTTSLDAENIQNLANEISNQVQLVRSNNKLNSKESLKKQTQKKIIRKEFFEKGKIDPKKIKLQTKIKFLTDLTNKIKKRSKEITSVRCIYYEEAEKRSYISNEKQLTQSLIKVTLVIVAFVKTTDGDTRYAYRSVVRNGYEATKNMEKEIKEICKDAKKILIAKKIVPKKYTALLSPDISGLLAHESFGHGMESDTVFLGRAKAKEFVGKKISKNFVSIADSPKIKGKHGSYFFDDEGNFSKKTYLVKKGVVKDYLTESFSAKKLGIKLTGNSRCESFDHKIYARMSNTFFEKGNVPMKKMLAKIKDGIYLIKASGGMEDPKGWGVQLQGIFGQRIKNGKLVNEYYTDIGVTGYLPTILSNIKAASKEFEIEGGGHCGKGHKEYVPVSSGGPYLLIENLELS